VLMFQRVTDSMENKKLQISDKNVAWCNMVTQIVKGSMIVCVLPNNFGAMVKMKATQD
jgi:hypothetical protein